MLPEPPLARCAASVSCCGATGHYAHLVAVAGAICKSASAPGQSPVISVCIDDVMRRLGLSRSTTTSLYLVATLLSATLQPRIGTLIDTFGPRRMGIAFASALVFACWFFALVVRGPVSLMFGFFFLRVFGQGAMVNVGQNVINQWWVKKRALVMGAVGGFMSAIITGVGPSSLLGLVARRGFRYEYTLLGFISLVVVLPIVAVVFRGAPEQYGMLPDGVANDGVHNKAAAEAAAAADGGQEEANYTRAEALATRSFWVISVGLCLIAAVSTGQWFNMVDLFEEQGRSADLGPVYLFIAVAGIASKGVGGLIIQVSKPKHALSGALLSVAVSCAVEARLDVPGGPYLWALTSGFGTGLMYNVQNVVFANFYGRAHLGAISGVVSSMVVLGSALGPMPFGVTRETSGSYVPALVGSAVLLVAWAGAVNSMGEAPPRKAGGAAASDGGPAGSVADAVKLDVGRMLGIAMTSKKGPKYASLGGDDSDDDGDECAGV